MSNRDGVISLFCGAGGMSLGFTQAGLKPVIAADVNLDACRTYQNNLGVDAFNIDLANENEDFNRLVESVRDPLAIIGGPPCQGFSSAGIKNGKDSRNKLIFQYLSIVQRVRPRWFLFENVEGLLTSNGGKSVVDLVREFIAIGYLVRLEKVNFAAYGLPQARKRVILMGNRIGIDFSCPLPTHSFNAGKHKGVSFLPFSPSLDEALAGLGIITQNRDLISEYTTPKPLSAYDALMRKNNDLNGVRLHTVSFSESLAQVFSKLRPGETMKDLPSEYWHSSFERRAFRRVKDGTPTEKRGGAPSGVKRLHGNLNALTITSAASREFIHPHEDRPLTFREAARLQSFPDCFNFVGNAMSLARQIGNAFPPLAAKIFAEHILQLEGSDSAKRRDILTDSQGALIGYRLTDATGMSPALASTNSMLQGVIGQQGMFFLEESENKEVA